MDDSALLLLVAGCGLALVIGLTWRLVRRCLPRQLPFVKRPALLSPAELRFYRALVQVISPGLTVFVKVRLLDVLSVPDHAWRAYGAPASGKHVDFVLADAAATEIRLVIELDDRSHWQPQPRRRDAFKDAALTASGVPILRIAAAARYDLAELRARISAAMTA
ncbi:MAG: DUF2726 domain-containing protein [Planctomycetes bacterium]|nr:DUF2726 domain-containing protein [Planctomycetota bacterium]